MNALDNLELKDFWYDEEFQKERNKHKATKQEFVDMLKEKTEFTVIEAIPYQGTMIHIFSLMYIDFTPVDESLVSKMVSFFVGKRQMRSFYCFETNVLPFYDAADVISSGKLLHKTSDNRLFIFDGFFGRNTKDLDALAEWQKQIIPFAINNYQVAFYAGNSHLQVEGYHEFVR